ncbi:MAG: hypothetical protein QM756_39020 [Polyangiaceae bacterium]
MMVARFQNVGEARAYLEALLPGWVPDQAYSDEWRRLFSEAALVASTPREEDHEEGSAMPREFLQLSNSVVALNYGLSDMFPELRALAWKRGAHVVDGIHLHGSMTLLAVVRARDADEARVLQESARRSGLRAYQHAECLLFCVELRGGEELLEPARRSALDLVGTRPWAADVTDEDASEQALMRAKQHLDLPVQPRLSIGYYGPDADARAQRFLDSLKGHGNARAVRAGGLVLIEGVERRKRLAVLGYRHEASVRALEGETIAVNASFWFEPEPILGKRRPRTKPVDRARLEVLLHAHLPGSCKFQLVKWSDAATLSTETADPRALLIAIAASARALDCRLNVWLAEQAPLAFSLRRLFAEARSPGLGLDDSPATDDISGR